MATEGGRIDFIFLGPPPLTRPLDPLLSANSVDTSVNYNSLKLTYIMGSCGQADGKKRKELSLFTRMDPSLSTI